MPTEIRFLNFRSNGTQPPAHKTLFRSEEHSTTLEVVRATVIWLGSVLGWNNSVLQPALAALPPTRRA